MKKPLTQGTPETNEPISLPNFSLPESQQQIKQMARQSMLDSAASKINYLQNDDILIGNTCNYLEVCPSITKSTLFVNESFWINPSRKPIAEKTYSDFIVYLRYNYQITNPSQNEINFWKLNNINNLMEIYFTKRVWAYKFTSFPKKLNNLTEKDTSSAVKVFFFQPAAKA